MTRPPERYLLPAGVLVPVRIAAMLERQANLGEVRTRLRGADPEFDAVLMAIRLAALTYRASVTGSPDAPTAEGGSRSARLSTSEAAAALGVTGRAIRLAIAEGRLKATRVGRPHLIDREDLEQYRAARAAKAA